MRRSAPAPRPGKTNRGQKLVSDGKARPTRPTPNLASSQKCCVGCAPAPNASRAAYRTACHWRKRRGLCASRTASRDTTPAACCSIAAHVMHAYRHPARAFCNNRQWRIDETASRSARHAQGVQSTLLSPSPKPCHTPPKNPGSAMRDGQARWTAPPLVAHALIPRTRAEVLPRVQIWSAWFQTPLPLGYR